MLRRDGLLTVEPELVVRGRMRPEPRREHACRVEDLVLTAVGERRGAGGDVAHHVAARTQCRHQVLVQRGDEGTQTLLGDEVELHALAGRDAQRRVREFAGHVIEGEPLLRGQHAARDACAHHARVFER